MGRIEIPRIGLSAIVGEGIDSGTLMLAVGHAPDSAYPGESGNVVVSGHRDSYFRNLGRLRVGDSVKLETLQGSFVYDVVSTTIVTPERTEVLGPTSVPMLTLVTCYPFHYIGSAPKRYIVRARQVNPAPTSVG